MLEVSTDFGCLDGHGNRVNMGNEPSSLLGHQVIPQLPGRIDVKGLHPVAKLFLLK